MVAPIYMIAIALGVAFLLPVLERAGKAFINFIFLAALASLVFISGQWLWGLGWQGMEGVQIFTAGVKPPLSINLQMGLKEAVFLSGINFLALIGGIYLLRHLNQIGIRALALFLLVVLGMNGLVMTRDIFNLFVFIEITSIASYALIGMDLNLKALIAGFKYMVAGSIASIFLLLGIILLYRFTGTLNIDDLASMSLAASPVYLIMGGLFVLLLSFIIEMKQFPANGWALDVYQAAHPGIAAIISAGTSGAVFFAFYKIMPLLPVGWIKVTAGLGLATFFFSNWMGLKQTVTTRMLGYSSVGQMGLLLMVLSLSQVFDPALHVFGVIIVALFFNHFLAKAGLYWLAGLVNRDSIEDWRVLSGRPALQFLFGFFVLALLSFPPFAGFWGKWSLIMAMAEHKMFWWIAILLIGSMFEAVYLLRWFGKAFAPNDLAVEWKAGRLEQHAALWTFVVASLVFSYGVASHYLPHNAILFLPLSGAMAFLLLEWLPARVKGTLAILAVLFYAYRILPMLNGLGLYFNIIFLIGGAVLLIAALNRQEKSYGFFPLVLLMLGSLSNLILADTRLQFFFAWELMTAASYLLILRGRKAQGPALAYVLFSLGGAYVMLGAFALAHFVFPLNPALKALGAVNPYSAAIYLLMSVGFLIKIAAVGLHIWAPGVYAEAEDDVTPLISGILSKAGIFGFAALFATMGAPHIASVGLNVILGWIGVLTAFFATLFAVFQEDAKKLLAYSSVGQVGYILLALAAMSHLGWAAALWHTLNHLLFKGLLFLAIAGVIYRTGTRDMYKMGGLIKQMPLSFVSVLIGIIALSGVPPLTGFGGKWLLYEALIEKGWYLQTGLAFFASTIAFLYCYRLIHSIFLGMPKPDQLKVKEAPVWFLIPQFILIMVIMIFSAHPALLLKPISTMIDPLFATTLQWSNLTVYSSLGYWNGTITMIMVGVIFVLLLVYLFIINPRPQKVKPFNIVFAAEKPEMPETTHYAYQFFTPYQRAMAPILKPLVRRFWAAVGEWSHSLAAGLRLMYTGNAQTYALFIFVLGLALYLMMGVK
ncbi:proton-conducting transporter transmembrane domain-containing protein [Caldithrix abyssi]|uniref:NADH/Ubiquinone/plastoquinone (Complex I) n=2 Tax=Caldithrix abyssi DSM 13497 TaxID=880073 RepID=H1XUT1_CALAY|nr:proton-conducting transporter membrane subunit [Caldithrix abyssi]EHO41630.1 NADH/Ubiquinone/plastoquinone (complex I) [Caldithrix abyssi DSM 13497]